MQHPVMEDSWFLDVGTDVTPSHLRISYLGKGAFFETKFLQDDTKTIKSLAAKHRETHRNTGTL